MLENIHALIVATSAVSVARNFLIGQHCQIISVTQCGSGADMGLLELWTGRPDNKGSTNLEAEEDYSVIVYRN